MKKNYLLVSLLVITLLYGCGNKENDVSVMPDTSVVEDNVSKEPKVYALHSVDEIESPEPEQIVDASDESMTELDAPMQSAPDEVDDITAKEEEDYRYNEFGISKDDMYNLTDGGILYASTEKNDDIVDEWYRQDDNYIVDGAYVIPKVEVARLVTKEEALESFNGLFATTDDYRGSLRPISSRISTYGVEFTVPFEFDHVEVSTLTYLSTIVRFDKTGYMSNYLDITVALSDNAEGIDDYEDAKSGNINWTNQMSDVTKNCFCS